jgi:hypothetical protein
VESHQISLRKNSEIWAGPVPGLARYCIVGAGCRRQTGYAIWSSGAGIAILRFFNSVPFVASSMHNLCRLSKRKK